MLSNCGNKTKKKNEQTYNKRVAFIFVLAIRGDNRKRKSDDGALDREDIVLHLSYWQGRLNKGASGEFVVAKAWALIVSVNNRAKFW